MNIHEKYMRRCLQLATLGKGNVSPNPMVGAVLVYNDKIIGEGYHQKYGENHAEVNCINSVSDKKLIPFSTLYVSLEPCSHFGKTPPCANFILENNIKKVVIATKDFSSKVNGNGIELLKNNGVEVVEHILEKEAIELNKQFFIFQEKKRPYIILKWAQSADGFIGKQHEKTNLSNPTANTIVHQWRSEEDAIWVGANTVLIDNPQLNVRHVNGKNPVRIVLDKTLSLPKNLHFFDQQQITIVFNFLEEKKNGQIHFIKVDEKNYLKDCLQKLYSFNISSLIIEGGNKLLSTFINQNLWDEARIIKTKNVLEKGVEAPLLKNSIFENSSVIVDDEIEYYKKKKFIS